MTHDKAKANIIGLDTRNAEMIPFQVPDPENASGLCVGQLKFEASLTTKAMRALTEKGADPAEDVMIFAGIEGGSLFPNLLLYIAPLTRFDLADLKSALIIKEAKIPFRSFVEIDMGTEDRPERNGLYEAFASLLKGEIDDYIEAGDDEFFAVAAMNFYNAFSVTAKGMKYALEQENGIVDRGSKKGLSLEYSLAPEFVKQKKILEIPEENRHKDGQPRFVVPLITPVGRLWHTDHPAMN